MSGCSVFAGRRVSEEAMANNYSVGLDEAEDDVLDEDFDFDDEEDEFLERSQRKLLRVKIGRAAKRSGDWD